MGADNSYFTHISVRCRLVRPQLVQFERKRPKIGSSSSSRTVPIMPRLCQHRLLHRHRLPSANWCWSNSGARSGARRAWHRWRPSLGGSTNCSAMCTKPQQWAAVPVAGQYNSATRPQVCDKSDEELETNGCCAVVPAGYDRSGDGLLN